MFLDILNISLYTFPPNSAWSICCFVNFENSQLEFKIVPSSVFEHSLAEQEEFGHTASSRFLYVH